jgi:hypothetical protein
MYSQKELFFEDASPLFVLREVGNGCGEVPDVLLYQFVEKKLQILSDI